MSFPEKLPFTAFAVGIAAAFQAANSSTNFATACGWCLVILAAAIETILFVLESLSLSKRIKSGIVSFAIATSIVILVFAVILPSYRKEFLTAELRVKIELPHPAQVGGEKLDLNYVIVNSSAFSIVVEEIYAVGIFTTDFSNNPSRNADFCKLQLSYELGRSYRENWPHQGSKVIHVTMDRPPRPQAENMFRYVGAPPFPDDKKLDVAVYDPVVLSEDGKDVAVGARGIEAGKAVAFVASFNTDAAVWDSHNVTVVCGGIKYLGNSGHEIWAVCPAWVVAHLYQNNLPAGELAGPAQLAPYTVMIGSNNDLCGVQQGP